MRVVFLTPDNLASQIGGPLPREKVQRAWKSHVLAFLVDDRRGELVLDLPGIPPVRFDETSQRIYGESQEEVGWILPFAPNRYHRFIAFIQPTHLSPMSSSSQPGPG